MALVDLIMPKMGESIMEATILKWNKKVGDPIQMDETVLEIATDKVDSEIPSPVEGTLSEILFKEGDVVEIGKTIARIESDAASSNDAPGEAPAKEEIKKDIKIDTPPIVEKKKEEIPFVPQVAQVEHTSTTTASNTPARSANRFYSPLVRSIASKENISSAELETISGSGSNGRVTKKDILSYLANRSSNSVGATKVSSPVATHAFKTSIHDAPAVSVSGADEIIQMDRMRKMIADHMVMSKQTSPHVTSFVEVDVTNIVNWRNKVKKDFQNKYGEKITFTPIFMEAVIKALRDFPRVNVSVDGDKIIVKKDINIGMATALPSGNLIVPVIKKADYLNLMGLTKSVNDLAGRARKNALKPDEISGGTFTLTNVGTFGNVMGTPIINQPQVAILAVGAIRKKPAVIETPEGDSIGIRQMMFLSLSYDHRVVDGFLGGSFLRRIGDYLEAFDKDLNI